MIYAVIDTNVVVSAVLSRLRSEANTAKVLEYTFSGRVTPVYNEEIIDEYTEVLSRPKFGFDRKLVELLVDHIRRVGISSDRLNSDEEFPDKDDIVFFEIVMSARTTMDAYLVTGNMKHYPVRSYIVTPREMIDIIEKENNPI